MTTHLRESMKFGPLTIEHDDRVLRPRAWTELQSRWAAEILADASDGPILELCTGAGQIGLLAARLSGRELVAVDLDPTACYFARLNAEGAGLAERVEVRQGRLETSLRPDEQFAIVVADPPWVTSARTAEFPEDPLVAIQGGDDGLDVARACLDAARGHVASGGSLLLQVGDQAQADAIDHEAPGRGWVGARRRQGARGVIQELRAR